MKKIITTLLAEFKWYRKRQGGLWYQVYETQGYNTIDGANTYWTQDPKKGVEVLKSEKYTNADNQPLTTVTKTVTRP